MEAFLENVGVTLSGKVFMNYLLHLILVLTQKVFYIEQTVLPKMVPQGKLLKVV